MLGAIAEEEHRRAPRTIVDVEAELRQPGQAVVRGIIHDLSFTGSLFIPEQPLEVAQRGKAQMRFSLPSSVRWIEPCINVRRITAFPRANGEEAQALGFEFSGLDATEERAIAAGCLEWANHRRRQYSLAADVFVQGLHSHRHFSRFGKLINGSREHVRISLAPTGELSRGAAVWLKVGQTEVGDIEGSVEDIGSTRNRRNTVLIVRLEGWGRDFFLHQARRESLSTRPARDAGR